MQYIIEKGYIFIDRNTMNQEQISRATSLGFRLNKEGKYQAQDDAVRRSLLKIDLPEHGVRGLDINHSLTKDQQTTAEKMISVGSLLNANHMGLGKTYETLAATESLRAERVLIVCPKYVRRGWRNELIKWFDYDDTDINIIEGTVDQRFKQTQDLKKYNIINYELLRNNRDKTVKALQAISWDVMIIDEAHRIKNRQAQQTKGVKRMKAKHKFALTGTPIQNKPDDLWSILQWIDPFYSGRSFWRFVENFCNVEENFFGKEITGLTHNEENIEALKRLLSNIMVRRSGDDELPTQHNIPIVMDAAPDQKRLYAKIRDDILIELEDDELFISSALTRLLRLQQTTSNPQLFDDTISNPKFEYIQELLEDNPEEQFLIFSRFKTTIYELDNYLKSKTTTLTGDTDDIEHAIKSFQSGGHLLATIGAVGEGVDGLQRVSNSIIFIDKDWSPAVNSQAIGRLRRKGQRQDVRIYDLMIEGTVDEYVERLLTMKREDIVKTLS